MAPQVAKLEVGDTDRLFEAEGALAFFPRLEYHGYNVSAMRPLAPDHNKLASTRRMRRSGFDERGWVRVSFMLSQKR